MNHSATAAVQTPWIMQVIGFLGFIFHFPSIILVFWFPPLVPFVQMFLLSGIIFCKFKFVDNQFENIPKEKYKYIK